MISEKEFLKTYDHLADKIFRHCFFRLRDREEAVDITQETFLRVWEYLSKGKEIENIKAFIYQVANNRIVDTFRKNRTSSLDEMVEAGFEAESEETVDSLVAKIDGKIAFDRLDRLPDNYRKIILLRFSDEMTITEIAKILKESEDNVSVRLHRALKKLKNIMENNG